MQLLESMELCFRRFSHKKAEVPGWYNSVNRIILFPEIYPGRRGRSSGENSQGDKRVLAMYRKAMFLSKTEPV